jgi:hypothetical protein
VVYSCFDGKRISKISFLLVIGYFFVKEASFPRENGRTTGSYSTFFNEFFLIKVGLFYLLLKSPSAAVAKHYKRSNNAFGKFAYTISSSLPYF